ncbi:hypothetical protein SAMN04490244_102365 [Tranquillimonas rosea]|uniref:UPF0235 protein SAMN04490244_102365 n=1 Tax=Tranquillimonas rosea TaxID=641238 RepID=A0A1H9RN57_9RHOB|nr:DUF167 domain-containing protein [Tranquillimonas rosea]SER74067.1 hypothetical protein SAMN04490244_102365 [Tranquillimonas rosea]
MSSKRPPDLSHLAAPGAELRLRATPGASRDAIVEEAGQLRVHVTAPPADGKANAAILKMLAKALGVPKSRLSLVRGASGRDKVVRVD